MADECFNRVIKKLPEIEHGYRGSPEFYFYGVSKIIELEWPRKVRPFEIPPWNGSSSEREEWLNCLDGCLDRLPQDSRTLVLEYYQDEKS